MSSEGLLKVVGWTPFGNIFQKSIDKMDKAKEAASAPAATPIGTTVDADGGTASDKTAARVGRAALIATSPEGVLGTSPTGRRKLLGN